MEMVTRRRDHEFCSRWCRKVECGAHFASLPATMALTFTPVENSPSSLKPEAYLAWEIDFMYKVARIGRQPVSDENMNAETWLEKRIACTHKQTRTAME
jgi:hypothetical protein